MTEDEIIESATRQFYKIGLKSTMQDVAGDLHIAKKTIYQFYPSKEELLIGMLDHGFGDIQKQKREILAEKIPYKEKVRRVMIAIPDQYTVLDFRKLSDLKDKYPKAYKVLRKHLENDWDPIIDLLNEGKEEGRVNDFSIPVLKTMVTASIDAFLSTDALRKSKVDYNDALNEMMKIILDGISEEHDEDHK
jgi:AcrR family transcriptional regulator